MNLDEYLWRTKTKQISFSRKTGIAPVTLSNLIRKVQAPTLLTALLIVKNAQGKITIEELLRPQDLKRLKENVCEDQPVTAA